MLVGLVLIALATSLASAAKCAEGYTLMGDGRCIKPAGLYVAGALSASLPKAMEECGKDKATFPVIKSEQENTIYNGMVSSFPELKDKYPFLVLDIVCNTSTKKLEWSDGSPIVYKPPRNVTDLSFDCVANKNHVVSRTKLNDWLVVADSATIYSYTFLCVANATDATPLDEDCGGYEKFPASADLDKPCFKIFDENLTWTDAEKKCEADFGKLATIHNEAENKYLARTAVARKLTAAFHIGAHQTDDADPTKWSWIDGEEAIGKKTYDNFIDNFPLPGDRKCAALDTETIEAVWVNEGCDTDKIGYVCRRVHYPTAVTTCPPAPPKEDTDIFPPGFPHPTIPCTYFLAASDTAKRVELEILALEANTNVDYLEIFDGVVGGTLLANLTGSTPDQTKYTTVDSDIMRVNWKPNGAINVRGFRMQYRTVDA